MSANNASDRVSVLISTYNRGPMMEESLASVLDQTVAPHQVIVIDDGSTDDTAARVARFGGSVELLRKENGGKARALNAAMPCVTGDFVWVFDDDDVALPASIEMRLDALAAAPEAGVVFSRHRWGSSGADGRIVAGDEIVWPEVHASNLLLTLMRGCFTTLQGALVRSESYRAVGPYREELLRSQDYDMLIRLARGCRVVLLDRPTFVFRRHAGQRGPAVLRHAADDRELLWARYDGMLGQALRREARLGEYLTPAATGELTPEQCRRATLNRMSVMASKGLAEELIEDATAFADQLEIAGDRLSDEERTVAVSSVQQRYFLLGVVPTQALFVRSADALARTRAGRALLRAFARGLLGVARWGTASPGEKIQVLRMALGLALRGWLPRGRR